MVVPGANSPPAGERFEGTRVVVTGGARGIGAAIARAFAARGATLAVVDHLPAECKSIAAELAGLATICDLADPAATIEAMSHTIDQLGGIDILVNNAGVFRITPLLDISTDEWDWIFSINVRAMLLTTQIAARRMIADGHGGKIVNMASMGGKVGAAGQAHYAASKAAVISLTQVAATELGSHGINVNSICPGYVLTEMGAATRTDDMIKTWSSKSPLGRLAEPSDVANMALFLASHDADYLTGQAFNVTGGMIMH